MIVHYQNLVNTAPDSRGHLHQAIMKFRDETQEEYAALVKSYIDDPELFDKTCKKVGNICDPNSSVARMKKDIDKIKQEFIDGKRIKMVAYENQVSPEYLKTFILKYIGRDFFNNYVRHGGIKQNG